MPQVVAFLALPGALTIFGVSVGSIFTAVAIGGSVLSLAKKPGKIGDRGRALELSTDPNAPYTVTYGRTAEAGSMVFQDVTNQNQDLSFIIALSNGGPIDGIEEIRLDDKPVTVDWATGNVTGKYAGYMRFEKRLGNNTEAAYGLSQISSFWSTTARGDNVASLWWALGWKDDLWDTGIPSLLLVLRGVKMYDPRKDTTAGGAGTHRISDPSTWEWSQNPALCALHYLIGVTENGKRTFGLHLPTAALDLPAFAVAADRCDELVTGKPRFTCGGQVTSTDNPEAVLDAFGAVMGGAVFQSGGLYTCIAGGPQTSTITLTDDDLAGPLEVTSAPPWRDVSNTVTVNFTDPDRDWRENTTAPITDAAFVAEDDGRELSDDVNLLLCNDADAGHRLGRLWLSNNREARTYTARWKAIAWALKTGMVCNIASAAFGITEKVMVTDYTRNPDGSVDLVLRTETDAKYSASDNFTQAMPQHVKVDRYDPDVVDVPSVTDWTLAAQYDADPAQTGIKITGQTPSTINRILRVEISTDDELTWLPVSDEPLDSEIDMVVRIAEAGKVVKIALSYFNSFGNLSDRFVTELTTVVLPAPSGLAAIPARIQGASGRDFGLDVTTNAPADWRTETLEVQVQVTGSGLWDKPGGKAEAAAARLLTPKIGNSLSLEVRARYLQDNGVSSDWLQMAGTVSLPAFENDGIQSFVQDAEPTGSIVTGSFWFDKNNGLLLHRFDGTNWLVVADARIQQAIDDAAASLAAVDGEIIVFTEPFNPGPTTQQLGDYLLDTSQPEPFPAYKWNGTIWVSAENDALIGVLRDAATAQATADGKVKTFYQNTEPAGSSIGDLWINTTAGKNILNRYDGTNYVQFFDPDDKLDTVPAVLAAPVAAQLSAQPIIQRDGAGLDKNGVQIQGNQTAIINRISYAPPATTEVHALALELEVTLADSSTISYFSSANAPSIRADVDVTSQTSSALSSARSRFVGAGINSAWVNITINPLSGITSLSNGTALDGSGNVSVDGAVAGNVLIRQDGGANPDWWLAGKYDYANLNNRPTTLSGHGITDADTSTQVDAKVAALVDSSPAALDTLNELAAALGDDPNFATTVTNSLADKVDATGGVFTKFFRWKKYANLAAVPATLSGDDGSTCIVGGVPAYYDDASGNWLRFSDDTAVT